MHTEPKTLLKLAIHQALPILRPLVGQFVEPYQVWRRTNETQWRGVFEVRPDIHSVFKATTEQIREVGAAFDASFKTHHPEYNGMVGFRDCMGNWGVKGSHLLDGALRRLWWQHRTFDLGEPEVDAIVQEFSDFIDSPTVRLRYRAPLLNFKMAADELPLPDGLRIRRLNEEEVSALHGDSLSTLGFTRPRSSAINEFALEGELDEPKLLGDNHPAGRTMGQRAKDVLDKAVLALRTYTEGHVGYDYIHFRPVSFCPIGFFPQQGCGDLYVPAGTYRLAEADLAPFTAHATLIFGVSEAAMEMACSRLADAENRTRPHDRAVDAVIGMEAILLAGLGKDERRGELSYRFSLRYSTLFGTPEERFRQYRVARDLYTLRSTIAHGNAAGGEHRVGDEKLSLAQAARRATAALRHVVRHFLPQAKAAPYKKPDYWDRALFGLPDPQ